MKIILFMLVALGVTFAHESHAQTVYQTPHDLFVDALNHGQAEGELRGEVAVQFTRQFHSMGPLLVRATVIKRYPQAGCARLDTVLTQKDVDTPQGKTDAVLKTQLNYCKDGTPPVSLD